MPHGAKVRRLARHSKKLVPDSAHSVQAFSTSSHGQQYWGLRQKQSISIKQASKQAAQAG